MLRIRHLPLGVVLLAVACSEAPLIQPDGPARLNNPISMVLLPDGGGGYPYAVVANTNIMVEQRTGSLVPVDLDAKTLLTDATVEIPSFSGYLALDPSRSRLYVPDHGDDALLVYDYALGVGGQPVTLTAVAVPTPADRTTNGVVADDNPSDVTLLPGTTPADDYLLVANNLSGSVTMIPAATLLPLDLNPDDGLLNGLILVSAANFKQENDKPGKGANRFASSPDGKLRFITSTLTNDIYVIDARDRGIEAMIDLSAIAPKAGTRDMAVSTSNLAYIAHNTLNAVVVLDVSGVTDNGIDFEVVTPPLVDLIHVGKSPEGVALSPDEKTLYVTNQGDDSLSIIDVATRSVRAVVPLPGRSPAEIVVDAGRSLLYVLNFLSNDITCVDFGGTVVGTIQ
jgi:YVTN family beta-propeller protein